MKKFITTLLLFLLPVIVVAIAFEILLRRIPNDNSYKRNFLDANAGNIEVLFLGNSHIYYGIDPKYIDAKSFNASNISQSLDYDLKILEKYSKDWKKLKYVVVPVDYFSLFTRLDSGIEAWRVKNYDIYYGIRSDYDPEHHFEIIGNQTKYNFERFKKYYLHGQSDLNVTPLGWGTGYPSARSKDLSKVGIIAAKRHREASKESFFSENVKLLHELAAFCKQRNAKLILVTSPAYKTYIENLDPHQMKRIENVLEKLTASDKTVRYYNLLTDSRYDSIDFYDADHFNEIGAKKFSMQFDSILKTGSAKP